MNRNEIAAELLAAMVSSAQNPCGWDADRVREHCRKALEMADVLLLEASACAQPS